MKKKCTHNQVSKRAQTIPQQHLASARAEEHCAAPGERLLERVRLGHVPGSRGHISISRTAAASKREVAGPSDRPHGLPALQETLHGQLPRLPCKKKKRRKKGVHEKLASWSGGVGL